VTAQPPPNEALTANSSNSFHTDELESEPPTCLPTPASGTGDGETIEIRGSVSLRLVQHPPSCCQF
jgi:hypothetical protein